MGTVLKGNIAHSRRVFKLSYPPWSTHFYRVFELSYPPGGLGGIGMSSASAHPLGIAVLAPLHFCFVLCVHQFVHQCVGKIRWGADTASSSCGCCHTARFFFIRACVAVNSRRRSVRMDMTVRVPSAGDDARGCGKGKDFEDGKDGEKGTEKGVKQDEAQPHEEWLDVVHDEVYSLVETNGIEKKGGIHIAKRRLFFRRGCRHVAAFDVWWNGKLLFLLFVLFVRVGAATSWAWGFQVKSLW